MSKAAEDRSHTDAQQSRLESAQAHVSDALSSARDMAAEKFGAAREATHDLRERASGELEDNPFAALLGGLALGAVAAAILPRTAKEAQLLGALGTRLTGAARDAASAAKGAGLESLDELGLTQDKARETVSKLFGDVLKAATTAATAGASAAKDTATGH